MSVAAVQPVSVAVNVLLDVAAFTALGTYDGPALKQTESMTFPRSYYQIRGEDEQRGLGGGTFPMVEIWVHALSTQRGFEEAHAITSKAKELLGDATFASVTGFTHAGKIFFDRIVNVPNSEVNGKIVRESVAQFFTWVSA